MPRTSTTRLHPSVVRYAIVGALVTLSAVWIDVQWRGNGNPVTLLQPGLEGPAAAAIAADFPQAPIPGGTGHDGQLFYAIARDPLPISASVDHLDRPRYRLQRPLLSWIAAVVHPSGGGTGLILALLLVSTAGAVVGGIGFGDLVVRAGGGAWTSALYPLLPGVFAALRISTADALAVGLALAALAAASRRRTGLASLLAVGAVLAKEPMILLLASVALARRDRSSLLSTASAAAAAGAWALYLRATIPVGSEQVIEFTAPMAGWADAISHWSDGQNLFGAAASSAAVAAAAVALVRRWGSPWTIPILAHLAFVAVLGRAVIAFDYNGSRTTMPLLVVSLLALVSPRPKITPPSGAPA